MKTATEERRICANEGCGRAAEPGEALCEGCGLEWGLLRRDLRVVSRDGEEVATRRPCSTEDGRGLSSVLFAP